MNKGGSNGKIGGKGKGDKYEEGGAFIQRNIRKSSRVKIHVIVVVEGDWIEQKAKTKANLEKTRGGQAGRTGAAEGRAFGRALVLKQHVRHVVHEGRDGDGVDGLERDAWHVNPPISDFELPICRWALIRC